MTESGEVFKASPKLFGPEVTHFPGDRQNRLARAAARHNQHRQRLGEFKFTWTARAIAILIVIGSLSACSRSRVPGSTQNSPEAESEVAYVCSILTEVSG